MALENPSDPPFGPSESADETRQAQHQLANDAPIDVNMNSIIARAQATTITIAGQGFVAAQERRSIMADREIGRKIE